MIRKKSLKGMLALGLAFAMAGIGVISPKVSALSGGSLTCDALKSTLRSDNSESGSPIIILSENCDNANLFINSGQSVTLDTAGHTLSSNSGATITVREGAQLVLTNYSEVGTIRGTTAISNSGKTEIKKGNIIGNIVEPSSASNAETIITGGTFSVDPTVYVAEGYVVEQVGTAYEVSPREEESEEDEQYSFDTSKVTSASDDIRRALIETIELHISDPDTSTLNGRMLEQLVNSIEQGHTITASLVIDSDPEISEEVVEMLLLEAGSYNLASVHDVRFVVTDNSDPTLSVSLLELAAPVSVTLPIPSQYKTEFAKRGIGVINVHGEEGDYSAEKVNSPSINSDGDVTFRTADFSIFGLIYDGDAITSDGEYDTDDSGSSVPQTGDTTVTGSTDGDVVVPNTAGFDNVELSVFHLLMLTGISLVVIALFAYGIKRAYTRSRISLK